MASTLSTEADSPEPVQKVSRRRKCKNHLAQLADMFPDVAYQVAAVYGSSDDQIYVMEVNVGGQVVTPLSFLITLNYSLRSCLQSNYQ